jgi:hypothetical protein
VFLPRRSLGERGTIGTQSEMQTLLSAFREVTAERETV